MGTYYSVISTVSFDVPEMLIFLTDRPTKKKCLKQV